MTLSKRLFKAIKLQKQGPWGEYASMQDRPGATVSLDPATATPESREALTAMTRQAERQRIGSKEFEGTGGMSQATQRQKDYMPRNAGRFGVDVNGKQGWEQGVDAWNPKTGQRSMMRPSYAAELEEGNPQLWGTLNPHLEEGSSSFKMFKQMAKAAIQKHYPGDAGYGDPVERFSTVGGSDVREKVDPITNKVISDSSPADYPKDKDPVSGYTQVKPGAFNKNPTRGGYEEVKPGSFKLDPTNPMMGEAKPAAQPATASNAATGSTKFSYGDGKTVDIPNINTASIASANKAGWTKVPAVQTMEKAYTDLNGVYDQMYQIAKYIETKRGW